MYSGMNLPKTVNAEDSPCVDVALYCICPTFTVREVNWGTNASTERNIGTSIDTTRCRWIGISRELGMVSVPEAKSKVS